MIGIACIASPIFDAHKRVVAAVSITRSVTNFDAAKMGPAVRTAALAMSRALSRADNVLAREATG